MIIVTGYKNSKVLFQAANNSRPAALAEATEKFYRVVRRLVDEETYQEDIELYLPIDGKLDEYGQGLGYYDDELSIDYYLAVELIEIASEEHLREREEAKAENLARKKAYSKAKRASRTKVVQPKKKTKAQLIAEQLAGLM